MFSDPGLLFALACIVLAVINTVQWVFLWKQLGRKPVSPETNDIDDRIDEMKAMLESGMEKNLKFEDQLWGILDKFKEQELSIKQIKNVLEEPSDSSDKDILSIVDNKNIEIIDMIENLKKQVNDKDKETRNDNYEEERNNDDPIATSILDATANNAEDPVLDESSIDDIIEDPLSDMTGDFEEDIKKLDSEFNRNLD